jgi:hypothetical protein
MFVAYTDQVHPASGNGDVSSILLLAALVPLLYGTIFIQNIINAPSIIIL